MVMPSTRTMEKLSRRLAIPQAATAWSPLRATSAVASMAAKGGISWLIIAGPAI